MSFEIGGVSLSPVYPVPPVNGQSGAGDSTESPPSSGSSDGGPDAVYEPSLSEDNEPLTYSNPYASAPSAPPADDDSGGSYEGEGSEPPSGELAEAGSDGYEAIAPDNSDYSDYGNDVDGSDSAGDYAGEDGGAVEQSYVLEDPFYEPDPAPVESDSYDAEADLSALDGESYGDPAIDLSEGDADPNVVIDEPSYGAEESVPDEALWLDGEATAQDDYGDNAISTDPTEDPYGAQAYGDGDMGDTDVDDGGDVDFPTGSGDEIPSDFAEGDMAAAGEVASDEISEDTTANAAGADSPAPSPSVASSIIDASTMAYALSAQRAASLIKQQQVVSDKASPSLAMALGHRPAAMSLALQIGQAAILPTSEKIAEKTDMAASTESTSPATPLYPARFARVSRAATKASPLLAGGGSDVGAQAVEAPKARANVMASAAYSLIGDAHRAERSVLNLLKFG